LNPRDRARSVGCWIHWQYVAVPDGSKCPFKKLPDSSKVHQKAEHAPCGNFRNGEEDEAILSPSLAVLVCSVIFACTGFSHADTVYVDSQKHFTSVSGVTIAHGAVAYVQIFLQKGIDPASFIKALSNGIETSHPCCHVTERGIRSPAAHPRMFFTAESPETPGAPRTRIDLETFVANGLSFAIICSSSGSGKNAPAKDLMVDYKVSHEMIQSLILDALRAPASMAAAAILATAPSPKVSDEPATGDSPITLSQGPKETYCTGGSLEGWCRVPGRIPNQKDRTLLQHQGRI
jgi:hypothetical protein